MNDVGYDSRDDDIYEDLGSVPASEYADIDGIIRFPNLKQSVDSGNVLYESKKLGVQAPYNNSGTMKGYVGVGQIHKVKKERRESEAVVRRESEALPHMSDKDSTVPPLIPKVTSNSALLPLGDHEYSRSQRPTGKRPKIVNVNPTEEDMRFLMPEASGRHASQRIFRAYSKLYKNMKGVFTIRESTHVKGTYVLDVADSRRRLVHVLIKSGRNSEVILDTTFPNLSRCVDYYTLNPLDLSAMMGNGEKFEILLTKCISQGISIGGGGLDSIDEPELSLAVTDFDAPAKKQDSRTIYHTVVIRKLTNNGIPFEVMSNRRGNAVIMKTANTDNLEIRNGDIILGVNGTSIEYDTIGDVIRTADVAFTLDLERTYVY